MGHLLNYWMGVQGAIYATFDMHDAVRVFVDAVNANLLDCVDLLAESPAEIIIMGDNFSSDIQPPAFFEEWSRPYYAEAIARLHRAGKCVAVHIDGRLRGALGMFRDIGADCADAVTPSQPGDLAPRDCRDEAGPAMILSGGVPPQLWLPEIDAAVFDLKAVNPTAVVNVDTRTPQQIVENIEEQGRVVANALARLNALLAVK